MATIMPGWMQTIVTVGVAVITVAILLLAGLLVYSRIVYVPQILMVEDKGVFNSIGRSFSLASGQIRRLAALFLFWIYVGWSVLLLLFLPLGYVSDWITPFSSEQPVWYSVAWQTVTQLSEILLMPIFMIGCTLLYLDSRVRKEGFDVELLANRTLAQPPAPPPLYPLTPEEAFAPLRQSQSPFATSILGLGLNDYSSAPDGPVPAQGVELEPAHGAELEPAPANGVVPGASVVSTAVVEAAPQAVSVGDTTVEVPRKSCQWCGAEANIEDRFCRVCGSVY
jgi:hypothetical protein